jgi:hypothetical protein
VSGRAVYACWVGVSMVLLPVSIFSQAWTLAAILTIQTVVFFLLFRGAACKD